MDDSKRDVGRTMKTTTYGYSSAPILRATHHIETRIPADGSEPVVLHECGDPDHCVWDRLQDAEERIVEMGEVLEHVQMLLISLGFDDDAAVQMHVQDWNHCSETEDNRIDIPGDLCARLHNICRENRDELAARRARWTVSAMRAAEGLRAQVRAEVQSTSEGDCPPNARLRDLRPDAPKG